MEQKIQVLVDNVADSARAVLQSTAANRKTSTEAATEAAGTSIQTSDIGRALSTDVGQLRRLVQASIAALRNAEIQDMQRMRGGTTGTAGTVEVTQVSAPKANGQRGDGSGRPRVPPLAMGEMSEEAYHTDNARATSEAPLGPDAVGGTDVRTDGWSPGLSADILEVENGGTVLSPATQEHTTR